MVSGVYTMLLGRLRGYPIWLKNKEVTVNCVLYIASGSMVVAWRGYVTVGR